MDKIGMMCLQEIGLHAYNLLSILESIVINIIRRDPYDHSLRNEMMMNKIFM